MQKEQLSCGSGLFRLWRRSVVATSRWLANEAVARWLAKKHNGLYWIAEASMLVVGAISGVCSFPWQTHDGVQDSG